MERKLNVALYGANGHQIYNKMKNCPLVNFAAAACVPESKISDSDSYKSKKLKIYSTLEEILEDDEIDLVSLCSPVRRTQAEDAIRALKSGKHVYAEKPAALCEEDLDAILRAAKESGKEFHEIADTAFFEPYYKMRRLLQGGAIGEIVQIYVQKSYPSNFLKRPQREDEDGGLTRQAGIHAARFIEHTCGLRITEIAAFETNLGNPQKGGELQTASSWIMRLENGGTASACINYLNPKSFGQWGNETLRAFGTDGMCEITDGGRHTRLYNSGGDCGEFDVKPGECPDFFTLLVSHLLHGTPMPFSLEEELHPLRAVINAKKSAVSGRAIAF